MPCHPAPSLTCEAVSSTDRCGENRWTPRETPTEPPMLRPPGASTFMPAHGLLARVAAAILAQLETADPVSRTLPWHGADPLPRNARTGRRYRGINVLALWCAAQAQDYADARWATYQQWAALGAQVRKAERDTLVLFYAL